MLENNFFSLKVFSRTLLAYDVHSSVTMDRHVQLASAYSLEAYWPGNSIFLLLASVEKKSVKTTFLDNFRICCPGVF